MQIYVVEDRTEALIEKLFKIWKASVKATHLFLSNEEIEMIAGFVPEALRSVPILTALNDENGEPIAFMGIDEYKLEMLFIKPSARRQGFGKALFEYAVDNYGVNKLCVNEQNPEAEKFYKAMGFKVYKRSEVDEQGNSYPILYMQNTKMLQ